MGSVCSCCHAEHDGGERDIVRDGAMETEGQRQARQQAIDQRLEQVIMILRHINNPFRLIGGD